MNESRMDELIAGAARELDPPPAAPRDEMWAAIMQARAAAAADAATARTATGAKAATATAPAAAAAAAAVDVRTPADVLPFARPVQRTRVATWTRWGAALAAMLVLGIGIGRLLEMRTPSAGDTVADAAARNDAGGRPATDTQSAGGQHGDTQSSQRAAVAAGTPETTAAPTTAAGTDLERLNAPPIRRVAPDQGGIALARATRSSNAAGVVREGEARTFDSMMPYRVAASRHFSRAQALLVAMPLDVREGRINEVVVRAADMLVNTRLLLASPAAGAPELRRLLEDLELILAQTATISPTRSAEDVEMIQNAINQRDVLIRLHGATTGPRLSGT